MQRLLQVVLTAWREADRVAAERAEGTREHDAALLVADRLRGLYRELEASASIDSAPASVQGASPAERLDPART